MPTYEYVCPEGHAFEKFQKMTDKPRLKCPRCGRMAVRQISAGAGLVFKGSGFYITDYGKDGKGPRKQESETSSETKSDGATKPEPKSDAKPAAKPDTKPGSKPAKKASGE